MKRIALLIVSFLTIFTAQAIDLTGVKIYINPGHGGYEVSGPFLFPKYGRIQRAIGNQNRIW